MGTFYHPFLLDFYDTLETLVDKDALNMYLLKLAWHPIVHLYIVIALLVSNIVCVVISATLSDSVQTHSLGFNCHFLITKRRCLVLSCIYKFESNSGRVVE